MKSKESIDLKKNIVPIVLVILLAVFLRLVPHPPNMAPIAAMALFGGVYLDRRYALVVPLLTLFLSDIALGFHSTMPFVYGSFVLTVLIGLWVKKQKTVRNILLGTLISSLLFFFITNFGVWITGTMYAKTMTGLLESYLMGIPFFRNTLLGDAIYTGLLFGTHETIRLVLPRRGVSSA